MEADIIRIPVFKRGGEKVFHERTAIACSCVGGGFFFQNYVSGRKFLVVTDHKALNGNAAKWEQQEEQDDF